jgi:ABC-type antimicrobial peptide transport system permease subunit
MTGFKQLAHVNLIGVVSYPAFQQLLLDFNVTNPSSNFDELLVNQGYSYNVPKQKLLIKYGKDITSQRREYIINGLRSLFPSGTLQPVIVDVFSIVESLKTVNIIFTFIVGVIGFISLILTFFLLLVATTQNIKDNIWEYGVLRSMGVTKAEGRRIFMYEAFLVIVAAGILGVLIGIIVACLVTAQFNMFLELPFVLDFPTWLVVILCTVALTTTYLAVHYPVSSVNKSTIAKILKSGA